MKALSIKDLSKTYRNNVVALKSVNLDIHSGDYFALLGPNGAGKTTMIGIITSLVNKSSGKVFIFGHDTDVNFSLAKSYMGVVPQEFNCNFFSTVLTIVLNQAGYYGIPRKVACIRAEYYLKKLNLWEKRHTIFRFLSGGMKRRLMIARALLHEPKILILDEPTAGVDVELRHSMWHFLKELNDSGVTIIMTTHYLEEAESQCRHVAIIDHGEIVECAPMAKLLEKLEYEHLILYLKEPFTTLPNLEGVKILVNNQMTLEVVIPRQLGINFLFSELEKHHIIVAGMRNKTNRLEELFLNLTRRD